MHNKTDILNIAGDLFSQRGYHGTTMRELARSLDLRGASLYSHIASKEEMLWEIVRQAAGEFLAQAEAVPQDIVADGLHILAHRPGRGRRVDRCRRSHGGEGPCNCTDKQGSHRLPVPARGL